MQRITRDRAMEYEFDHRHSPKMSVEQGESFVIETEDAGSGLIRSADIAPRIDDLPTRKFLPPKGNPIGGPVFVQGAERGDLLEVTIEKIIVDDQGFTTFRPGQGPLGDSLEWRTLTERYVHIVKHLPGPSGTTRDGKGVLNESITWDLQPMVGTIGTAPDREVETSAVGQGPWGGNMDVRDIKEGTKVFLNCYHEGALLYVGDVHASQGDTEFYGTADETRAEVTLSCRVIKNKTIPFVRLEKSDSIISLYCFRPLEDAVESAIVNLMRWIVDEYGVSERDAYMHTSLGSGYIAAEERSGTLDVLLSNPLKRSEVLVQKSAAMIVAIVLLALVFWLSAVIGALIVQMDIGFGRVLEATVSGMLLGTAFGAFAMALGSATGKRGMAIGVTGAVAVASYFIYALLPLVESLEAGAKVSPFYYYIGADPLANGLSLVHAAVLLAMTVAMLGVALFAFERRDLAV